MFSVQPVFVSPESKKKFISFFLKRVNDFAEAHAGQEWKVDMGWTMDDFDRLFEEFSFANIKIPFSKLQLSSVASWIKSLYPNLFLRFKVQELQEVFSKAVEVSNLDAYLWSLVETLQDWDDCPRGFSKINVEDVVKELKTKLVNQNPLVPDPPIFDVEAKVNPKDLDLDVEDEDAGDEGDEVETSSLVVDVAGDEEEAEEDDGEAEEEEEEEAEEEEPPPPVPPKTKGKVKSSPPKAVVAPKVVKTVPGFKSLQGPKLVTFIKATLLKEYFELKEIDNKDVSTLVAYSRTLSKETDIRVYLEKIINKAMTLVGGGYDIEGMIDDMIENWSK